MPVAAQQSEAVIKWIVNAADNAKYLARHSEAANSMAIGAIEVKVGVGMANAAWAALKAIVEAVDKVVIQTNEF